VCSPAETPPFAKHTASPPSAHLEHLRRYASIVDDMDAFLAASRRPLPRVVWANPLRTLPDDLDARIRRYAPEATPLGWMPKAWRIAPERRPGAWPEFRLGLLHAQEEATLWPARLLDAQPGERILDMCAAPGNKTALIACAMGDRGEIIANDKVPGRLSALRYNLERLGITSVAVTRSDACRLPFADGTFDRVLVDVPCTCEGTGRKLKGKGNRQTSSTGFHHTLVPIQKGLLRRALRLVRPGGIVVYATCTYAPEENEQVLDGLYLERAEILPITPPVGFRVAPGVTSWEGRDVRPDVVHAARIWPHHNDTGGFFVARIRAL
jgi:16S rRNA C967 or C1407 C5-methylase (RsmB/RsmF family)